MAHQTILDRGKDYYLSADKVLYWIEVNQYKLPSLKYAIKSNVKGAISDYHCCQAYIREMRQYLRTGTWISDFYGENQQFKTQWRNIHEWLLLV